LFCCCIVFKVFKSCLTIWSACCPLNVVLPILCF
jgi:hypothetical protein